MQTRGPAARLHSFHGKSAMFSFSKVLSQSSKHSTPGQASPPWLQLFPSVPMLSNPRLPSLTLLSCRPVYPTTLQVAPLRMPAVISNKPSCTNRIPLCHSNLLLLYFFTGMNSCWLRNGKLKPKHPLSSPPASNGWLHLGVTTSPTSPRSTRFPHGLPSACLGFHLQCHCSANWSHFFRIVLLPIPFWAPN